MFFNVKPQHPVVYITSLTPGLHQSFIWNESEPVRSTLSSAIIISKIFFSSSSVKFIFLFQPFIPVALRPIVVTLRNKRVSGTERFGVKRINK